MNRRHASAAVALVTAVASWSFAGAQSPTMPDSSRLIVPNSGTSGKTYLLPATPQTTQIGFYDSSQPPVLTINLGDTVIMETRMLVNDRLMPGVTMDDFLKLRPEVIPPGGTAHTLTGPIYVNGAEPGDVLRIKINKIVPRSYGVNFNLPGAAGEFPQQFPQGSIRFVYLDLDKNITEFLPGIVVPLLAGLM